MNKKSAIVIIFMAAMSTLQVAHAARPFCVAHRSLGYGGLENSLEAFENASKSHASAIEFDLLHTKDGQTLVHHDSKLGRVVTGASCPTGKKIEELTFSEIRKNCKLKNGEVIPTLKEALDLLLQYDSTLFIEFKDKKITEEDFSVIKNHYFDHPEKIMIISFIESILATVERKKESDEFFKQVKTIQLKKIGFYANIDDIDGISTKYINKSHVERLQAQGKLVGVYTKDSEEKIQKYLDKGVDFVTTNNTPLCESLIR